VRLRPSRDARLGDRNGHFGIMAARALLLGAVPHPNILGRHPEHPRQRLHRIGPVPHQGLGPARLARRAVSVKDPPNPNYISISLWGVLYDPTLGGLGLFNAGIRVSLDHMISYTAV
jgi:hypothetical protein